jgi:hypothetical protein
MGGADPDSLRRQQQHAVGNSKVAAAFSDQLSEPGVASRRAVNFLIDLVDEFQLTQGVFAASRFGIELLIETQGDAEHVHGRHQGGPQVIGIEARRLALVFREHDHQQAHPVRLAADGQQEQGTAGRQRVATERRFGKGSARQVRYVILDLEIVRAIAAPEEGPGPVVIAEALRPWNERSQEPFCPSDDFADDDALDFRSHRQAMLRYCPGIRWQGRWAFTGR